MLVHARVRTKTRGNPDRVMRVLSGRVVGLLLGTLRRPTDRAPEPGRQKKADAAHAGQGVRDCSGALGLAVLSVRVRTAARPSLARGDCRARVSVPRYWDR